MAANAIWRLDYKWCRCYTERKGLSTQVRKLKGARGPVNTYYAGALQGMPRVFAWDVDVPADRVGIAENILRVQCDHSTSCKDVRPETKTCTEAAKSAQKRHSPRVESILGARGYSIQPGDYFGRSCGSEYYLVARTGDVVILALAYPNDPRRVIGYDVVRLKGGKLPDSEAWGYSAWSFSTMVAALGKYCELL